MRVDRRAFSTALRLKSSRRTGTRVRFHRAEPPLVRGSEPTSKFLHALSPQLKSYAVIFSALFRSRLNARDVVTPRLPTSLFAQICMVSVRHERQPWTLRSAFDEPPSFVFFS